MKIQAAGMEKGWPSGDYLSREGAYYIGERITEYWAKKGLAVKCWVDVMSTGTDGIGQIFVTRSDMVRGWPRDAVRSRS